MKEKKHWNRRVLSFFLALAMVITQLGGVECRKGERTGSGE